MNTTKISRDYTMPINLINLILCGYPLGGLWLSTKQVILIDLINYNIINGSTI